MIIVYYSNKLEYLKNILIELFSNKKLNNNPFCSEIILTEDLAMMEWLHIELAKSFGISANIKFFSSLDFIWHIFHTSLWNIFPENIMSDSMISWMFMKVLSNMTSNTDMNVDCSIIKKYLYNDVNKCKSLQLSKQLTKLFMEYFLYRQDWLFRWQSVKNVEELDRYDVQLWQSKIWRLFLDEINKNKNFFCYFKCNIYKYILNSLKKNNTNLSKLPKRFFIYNVLSFSPILLEILKALGKYIDIYIFYINPCRFFSYNRYKRCNKINNSLLSLCGGVFQDTIYLLSKLRIVHEHNIFFENVESSTLLHILQDDILNNYPKISYSMDNVCSMHIESNDIMNQRLLSLDDTSVSVHVCHSIHREIEVLHDNLLSEISNNSSLSPNEIIVMAPDIKCYEPAIRSVFNYASVCGRYLPFTIFNSSINNIHPIISSILKLLKISYIRFTTEEILEFLEISSLAMRFDIDKDDFKLLRKWILKVGIRWGLDDEMISNSVFFSVSGTQNTWEFGLNRMFLGYAMDNSTLPWKKILPYNVIQNDNTESMNLIGQLNQFLIKLKYWKRKLSNVFTLKEWLPLLEEIINDFYIIDFDVETESNLILLKKYWREIVLSGMKVNYSDPISVDILHAKLFDKINKQKIKSRFFSGGIVFCNLYLARSIPFKIVYLLGMSADVYPSHEVSLDFNLMMKQVRLGDNNSRSNDFCVFLEALLSARNRLFISFVGYSMVDGKKNSPSILISELFEHITRTFHFYEKNTKRIFPLTMDWIQNNLWCWHSYLPFELENFLIGSKKQSFFKEWLFCPNDISKSCPKFLSKLPPVISDTISLDNLYDFYRHPVRAWFKSRLKIHIPKIEEILIDEPFFVDGYVRYQICRDLVSFFLEKKDVEVVYQKIRCSGMLPYGHFGDLFWIKQYKDMMKLSEVISRYYIPESQYDLKVSLTCNNIQLTGTLYSIQKNGLIRWKPKVLSVGDGLLLWLEHLVYCVMGGEGDSWMFGIDSFWHFSFLSCIEAKEYLLFLIFGYFDGMSTPLLLFSNSGGCWLRHCFDFTKRSISLDLNFQSEARKKLITAWKGDRYVNGDVCDPYIKTLIPELKNEDIESIILAAKTYFIFPMKFNISDKLN